MQPPAAEIPAVIQHYLREDDPTHRYRSFDYCYHYFRTHTGEALLADKEKSCLALGFYLASWGMLRGSSFLLSRSSKYFEGLVEYIAGVDKAIWEIDVDNYTPQNIETILDIYQAVKRTLIANKEQDLTLVTKVLLGVFGFVPAFDSNFCHTFRKLGLGCGFRAFNTKSLRCIADFYLANKEAIDTAQQQLFVLDFRTGQPTSLPYPKAKIVDMYGFAKGL